MSRKKRAKQKRTHRESPEKLKLWQQRLADSDAAWAPEVVKMDNREKIYKGDRSMRLLTQGDKPKDQAPHVRNIVFENIESMVSSAIPQPKVTAKHPEDEGLAEIVENFIRNELDRLPSEVNNDMAERTVPMQGGVLFHGEWDDTVRSHTTAGVFCSSVVHPKQLAPQPGVYTGIDDMDWFILKVPTTKTVIQRKYDVCVRSEAESEPGIRSTGNEDHSDEALTQYIGYEKNDTGGINKYSWVNDIELLDLEDYQARRQPVCKKCGRLRPLPGQVIGNKTEGPGNLLPDPQRGFLGALAPDGLAETMDAGHAFARNLAERAMVGPEEETFLEGAEPAEVEEPAQRYDDGPCPWCGGEEWNDEIYEYERVILPIHRSFGPEIPGEYMGTDAMGNPAMVPTLIPFYKPDIYPVILQKSVSVFGQLLGNSDVDAIADQQNTINRIEKKIIDRLVKAGTRITLPNNASLRIDQRDSEIWYLDKVSDRNMIGVYQFSGELEYELVYLNQVYEESRQILGITDSFQGRKDPTATSGKAKEYSAAQAAGRMESKRIMKNAAYAKLFELMFKFQLAYADEPRPVAYKDYKGETVYKEFNRYDFLKQDANGEWYWNDEFLFSVDTAGPLASNREAMWQETRMNLQTGAFGDPASTETLVLFWGKMELLHYPGAASTKKYLEDKLKREQEQTRLMMQMQAMQAGGGMSPGAPAAQQPGIPGPVA